MALVRHDHCRQCEGHTLHIDSKCSLCEERKERERTLLWNTQTVEEKLQDLRRRVEKMEMGPTRY